MNSPESERRLCEKLYHDLGSAIIDCLNDKKIHEIMCPRDDYMHTLEFDSFFIIKPTISVSCHNFNTTMLGEEGKPVAPYFEYNSFNNPHYLSVEEIAQLDGVI